MENNRIRFISLFAGIGGFDLGLERAGMECVAQVEIDPFCQKVLAKHWPDVERFSDVRECGKHNLPAADLICGGFPCQPHSVAGKRRGAEDDRDLWPEYRRIVEECRPRWVIGENVPGIRTTILDQVLSDLEGLDYAVRTLVVPACAFDAPHRRERIFIVANTRNCGQRVLLQHEHWIGEPPSNVGGNGKIQSVAHAQSDSMAQLRQQGEGAGEYGDGRGIPTDDSWEFWAVEPPVGRVANGVSARMDRLRALGNAVVPQVVEWIGRMIVEADKCA